MDQKNLMVFGDGGNDIEMLKLAKYSFAMANAPQEIKSIAHYEAPSKSRKMVYYKIFIKIIF